jgi:acyl-homoserine lactone acylase PvdQ
MQRRTFVKSALGGAAGAGLLGTGTGAVSAGSESLPEEVEILTDEYNESHVYADSLYGLSYGNGYVQARDRLFIMDIVRHIGYGNSAKVLGPAQLPSDIQVKRDLYSEEQIEAQWENASETIKTAIRGYTDGVNRRMTEMAAQGELPAEFAALGHAPEPWKPEDSVAAIDYLIGFFGVSGGEELASAKTLVQLQESLGSMEEAHAAYEDLNWLRTRDEHYTSIPEADKVVEGGETVPEFEDVPDEQLALVEAVWSETDAGEKAYGVETWGIEGDVSVPADVAAGLREGQGIMEGFKWGSNAMVVDGELSETDAPLLGGGPQMGYFKPPVPYEIGLHGDGFDVTGMGVVCAPTVIIGRTASGTEADTGDAGGDAAGADRDALALTVTSGRDKMIDTIAIELDPDDKHRYNWQGEWYEMETHQVTHTASPVAPTVGGDPEAAVVEQEVARVSPPGVDQSMPVIAWNRDPIDREDPVAWCQRITSRNDELTGSLIWSEFGRLDDLDDFEDTFAEFPFTFNFHLVSESGDIEYYHTGKVPRRGGTLDHRLPATSGGHEWNGTFYTQQGAPSDPDGDATTVRNPSRGYVVNWNNGPAAGWRAGRGEQNWGSIHRVDELDHWVREALGVGGNVPARAVPDAASDDLSVEDVKTLISQAALHDASAQFTVPYMADVARRSDDAQLRRMGELLTNWRDSYCAWHDERAPGPDEPYDPPTDGDDRYVHAGHAIYDGARKRLQELTFGDELDVSYRRDVADDVPKQYPGIDFEVPVSLHAGDHGEVFDDVTFYDALRGETVYDWFDDVRTDTTESADDLVERALVRTAGELEAEFGTPDPEEWLMEVHESKFLSIGATPRTTIDMRNRSSYNQAIEIERAQKEPSEAALASEEVGEWATYAGDVLPPGNSGQLTAAELARGQATGEYPDRLTDQLALYVNNVYKPHPVTRRQVEDVADTTETIRTTPERPDAPLVPIGSPPPEVLAQLLGDTTSGGSTDADETTTDGTLSGDDAL